MTEDEGAAPRSHCPACKWPCYFFKSDTTARSDFEEFFTDKEVLDMARFESIGVTGSHFSFRFRGSG